MPPEPMFLSPGGLNPQFAILVIGAIGLIVGNVWLRRIAGPDPDRQPPTWRYRNVRVPPRWPTTGWFATRFELTIAVMVFFIVLAAPAVGLATSSPHWFASVALAAIGTVWTLRIARSDPEAATPPWRYRDR